MSKVVVVDREGMVREVAAKSGLSLMQIIRNAGFDEMLALCGGCRSCATCHVHIDPAFANKVAAMSEEEDELLDGSSHRNEYSRLACQIPFDAALDGLKVQIAREG